MKIALVHDYLREYGGAERVVEVMHEMWPGAPIYTSFVDKDALREHWERFADWDIRTSWVQQNWFVKKCISPLRFLAPKIWESFDLSDYDLVISSSGWFMCRGIQTGRAEVGVPWFSRRQGPDLYSVYHGLRAKAVTALETAHLPAQKNGPLHICYIHHPPRNLYGYPTGSDLQKYWPVRVYATVVNFFLRHYDYETAQRVDYFIANSKETARRVEKFYRRNSIVIYPPITQGQAFDARQGQAFFLSVGRLTYSKRVDLAIEACNKLKLPLKIVGTGKEEEALRAIAGPTVEFLGSVSDEELGNLYAGAKALIFCALDEDFGMVPVEAMAHGTPVIALGQGGVVETVVDGKTGVLFYEPTIESLEVAMKKFQGSKGSWGKSCIKQAEKFNKERFKKELKDFISRHLPR